MVEPFQEVLKVMVDGQRLSLWSGEFHYWRLPSPDLWRDVLEKMKAGGYNAANIYFHWGFHSPAPGVYDFTGIRDVDRLLDIAAEVGIYVIARPGPYINAETDGGGLPAWLDRLAVQKRSNDPVNLAYSDEWLSQIQPHYEKWEATKPSSLTDFMTARGDDIAEDLLKVTDRRAEKTSHTTAKKMYGKMRDGAKRNVVEAIPDLAKMIEKHVAK